MNKVVLVNATSATVGGSLTILNQFIENIDICSTKIYYIFVPINSHFESFCNVEFVPIEAKKYIDRIKWDLIGVKRWCKVKNIKPDLIISLQNTNVIYKDIPQIAYLHQPLPYAKESSWNLLKKDERKMWFYKYLYKVWINMTVRKNHHIIIQTEWMKRSIIDSGFLKENIIVAKPYIKDIDIEKIKTLNIDSDKILFYPAANYKYKNHDVIIEAINIIKNNSPNLVKKIKIIFTLDKESELKNKVEYYELSDTILFIGNQKYDNILSYFKSSDVVLFPSYIETFGLPLIEASIFGKKILVADCDYSKEVLNGYDLATYIKYDDAEAWSEAILCNLEKYDEKPIVNEVKNEWKDVFNLINNILDRV